MIPNPRTFFVTVPLYEDFPFDVNDAKHLEAIWEIISFDSTIDVYCYRCKKHSTFKHFNCWRNGYHWKAKEYLEKSLDRKRMPDVEAGYYQWNFHCTRCSQSTVGFIAIVSTMIKYPLNPDGTTSHRQENWSISKCGQNPSIADLQIPDIQKYRSLLGKQYSEFAKAIGLFAHGIGIGSFVYLRRIFESLIEEAHQKSTHDATWDEEQYISSRWNERILVLKEHLPQFLVKHPLIYSILSKGIHELSEEECKEYFPPLKLSIELILDDKLAEKERERKEQEAVKSLGEIHEKIKGT